MKKVLLNVNLQLNLFPLSGLGLQDLDSFDLWFGITQPPDFTQQGDKIIWHHRELTKRTQA